MAAAEEPYAGRPTPNTTCAIAVSFLCQAHGHCSFVMHHSQICSFQEPLLWYVAVECSFLHALDITSKVRGGKSPLSMADLGTVPDNFLTDVD
jgi:hypothetical protein